MKTRLVGRLRLAVLCASAAWGGFGVDRAEAQTQIFDVIGNMPASEYLQFIGNQSFKDWGNEPFIAVNPLDPNKIAITTFAYGIFINSGEGATKASIWYSEDGGASWGIRFPINQFPQPGARVPNDQTIAYDSQGNLHGGFLTYGSQFNVFHGLTSDPNADGVNGRPPSVWQWNPDRVNLPSITNNNPDQPWMALAPNGKEGSNVFVGYDSFRGIGAEMRVSASLNNGATFTNDNPINQGGPVSALANPGLRVATDQVGNVYTLFGQGDANGPNSTTHLKYRLNMSSDGGATWNFTNASTPGGLVVADGFSLQLGQSFGNVNRLTGNITAIAADPTGQHVYTVYGLRDKENFDRIWIAEFHPDGMGGLERRDPVAVSIPGQRSAMPSIAVTNDGTIFVLYDTFADGLFHVHLAVSSDLGLTFSDEELDSFSGGGIPFPNTRLLGDYQFMEALGNSVYGVFSGRGFTNDGTINTTNLDVPIYFTANSGGGKTPAVPEPATISLVVFAGGILGWVARRRR